MEQIEGCFPVSPLSIGIGIGIAILVFFKCVLFHADPLYCLKCHIHLFLGFMFVEKDKTGRSPATFSFSSSSNCNCTKPGGPEPPVAEHPKEEKLLGHEVETVMEGLGIFSINPDGGGGTVGAQEIEQLFEEQEPSLGEVKEAFDVFDKNRDGFIDAGELRVVLWALGLSEVSEADCQRLIRAFDENRDGRIDFREFTKLVEKSFCSSHNQ
ncbi:probable calcium-binding protein CML30 [Punica granatum]|uniref:EF-hand domain-containing protein n=2 Tax=Punica granatum TaxID=22663 RepID=A0A218VYD7_PUNGR|nr:probable calcium-binding protein CML30 [Punica granatum]OWM65289.1 hypothetical protein CDL15_Pgr008879 [Punica granatum]PKI63270.1 hypothetical protein CRG98_016455 [Punica granatum]